MILADNNRYIALKNNFDLLRLLLASTVFFVHLSALAPFPYFDFTKLFNSELAVKSFFIVSGFLVFRSFENSQNVKNYFFKRFSRIYPGYFAVTITSILISIFTCLYIDSKNIEYIDYLKYLLSNLVFLNFLHPNLPGLFSENFITSVNGALWTLKIEVIFYASVPIIIFIARRRGYLITLIIFYLLSISYRIFLGNINSSMSQHLLNQFPGQLIYFLVGASGFYYFDILRKYSYVLFLLIIAIILFRIGGWTYDFLEPFFLGIIIVYFVFFIPYLGNFSKYGDFSYGIYIIHFPLIQIMVQTALFNSHPLIAFFVTIFLVFSLSFILWHLVEKPFLIKSSYWIRQK